MQNFSKNIISQYASVVEAMRRLNDVPISLTLFVVDDNQRLVGALTDGDIRRGFINGLTLDDSVDKFMIRQFYTVNKGFTVHDYKKIREKGIRLLPVLDESGRVSKVYDLKKRKSILPLECMIMAGGRGERLRPLTNHTPKPMLMLGNKPIIEHIIDRLISFGIEKIYISIKYLGQQVSDYFGDGSSKGISIEYILEEQPLGTAGALSLVKDFGSEYILHMNSDLFTDVDFEDLYLNVISSSAQMGVASIPYTTKIPYGVFSLENERITGVKEKPAYTYYANAGIYILNKAVINRIPHNTFCNITDLITQIIQDGYKVIHNPIVGYWIDIGQHQDYINAQEVVKHLKHE